MEETEVEETRVEEIKVEEIVQQEPEEKPSEPKFEANGSLSVKGDIFIACIWKVRVLDLGLCLFWGDWAFRDQESQSSMLQSSSELENCRIRGPFFFFLNDELGASYVDPFLILWLSI